MADITGEFVRALERWKADKGLTQRALAEVIGCHESLVSQVRSGERKPTPDFMSRAIARAEEPYRALLRQARQSDQEAADAAVAVA